MKGLFLITALFINALCGAQAETAGEGLPPFLVTWLEAQKLVGDVRLDFTLSKTLPTLKEPVKSPGRFWNYADGRFLWEAGSPPASVLRYDGLTLESWEASENKWRNLDANHKSLRLWMYFLSGKRLTAENLEKEFLIASPVSNKQMTSVTLEPRSKRQRRDLKQIELKFITKEQRLVQLVVWQGDGGTQLMEFGRSRPMTAAERSTVPGRK